MSLVSCGPKRILNIKLIRLVANLPVTAMLKKIIFDLDGSCQDFAYYGPDKVDGAYDIPGERKRDVGLVAFVNCIVHSVYFILVILDDCLTASSTLRCVGEWLRGLCHDNHLRKGV